MHHPGGRSAGRSPPRNTEESLEFKLAGRPVEFGTGAASGEVGPSVCGTQQAQHTPSILPAHRRACSQRLRSAALALGMVVGACGTSPAPVERPTFGERPAPPRPGDSLTRTRLCSCKACEPDACCTELERPPPELEGGCSEGYDFSRCETPVTSCLSRCFQRRWRARIETGCEAERPHDCCSASADE